MKQQEFLEIEGPLVATPEYTANNSMLGWAISRNGIFLERNRGGVRTFKMKDSIDAFCTEHGIESYLTKGL